eukprot:3946516-Ditylum_brightwellii.AAC.1
MQQFKEEMETRIEGKINGMKKEMDKNIETTMSTVLEASNKVVTSAMDRMAQNAAVLQGVVDTQTERVAKIIGINSEATNNKVDDTSNKINNTNSKVDAQMAMLQQQNMNMMNQTTPYKSPMGQMMSNQYMAVTPNNLSFQQAQQQIAQDPQAMGMMTMFHPGMSNQLMGGS